MSTEIVHHLEISQLTFVNYYSFDVEQISECDDEYWIIDNQELKFAQPPDKPSKITAFNCMLRLTCINAEAYRIMVSHLSHFPFILLFA